MCVAMRSRNHRSCEMTITLPAKPSNASSSARSVSTSRSLDGSSSSRTFAPDISVLARCSLPRSPPDNWPTIFCWSPPLKLKRPRYAREGIVNLPTVIRSCPPAISSNTVLSADSSSRDWSTYASCTVLPSFTSPESGFSLPVIMRNSVDLPAPFGPITPTIAPGGTLNESLSSSIRSPKPLVTSVNSMTSLPRRSATGMKISEVSFRCWLS